MKNEFRYSIIYLDFIEYVNLCNRLSKILISEKAESKSEIPLTTITAKLKWYNPVNRKYQNKSISLSDMERMIDLSFEILVDLGFLKEYKYNRLQDYHNSFFEFTLHNREVNLNDQFEKKGYFPIAGVKQEMTKENWDFYNKKLLIDYSYIMSICTKMHAESHEEIINEFRKKIEGEFLCTYEDMVQKEILGLFSNDNGFICVFDEDYHMRTIAYHGYSHSTNLDRSKISQDLKKTLKDVWADKETDRGHFMAHSIGGSLDANIFPQKRDINQGKSERGKVYRKMEEYCRKNNNTFCFSRPIYFDDSIRPYLLEFGLIKKDGTLWVELFENV